MKDNYHAFVTNMHHCMSLFVMEGDEIKFLSINTGLTLQISSYKIAMQACLIHETDISNLILYIIKSDLLHAMAYF